MIKWNIKIEIGEADPNRWAVTENITALALALQRAGVQHSVRVRRDRTNIRPDPSGEPQQPTTKGTEPC